MRITDAKRRQNRLARRMFFRFLTAEVGLFFALLFGGGAAYVIGHSVITWYDSYSFLYRLLKLIDNNLIFSFLFLFIVGTVVLLLRYWQRMAGYIDLITHTMENVYDLDAPVAELPEELSHTQEQLNRIRYNLIRNQQLAHEAEQRKNDLVVYLAHDLKTPLTSVLGYLTLLHDAPELPADLRDKYLSIALNKAERLEELINEFFEITRFNLQTLELERSHVNLSRMLEQLADEFVPLFEEKGLHCTVVCAPNLTLYADVGKLERVFDNLIRNAIHYSFPQSEIHIEAHQDAQGTTLTFENAGNTIPPHKLSRIFEQFYRLDASRSTTGGGAGLGLAIAKEIVELHGGTITAASENERITFTIYLPSTPA